MKYNNVLIKCIIFAIINLGDILKFQIDDYTILVEVIGEDKELKTIHVICENSNNDLGLFYTNKIDKETIKYLVLNTYEIIFNKNRCISGTDLEGNNYQEIDNIYKDYINETDTYLKEKYRQFLCLYFNSHNITDGIRKIYIDKFNKSLLDDNIDMLILKNLSNGTNYLSLEKEHITKVHKLETLESDKLNKEEELKILNEIIIRLKTLVEMIDYNHEVTRKLYILEERLSNLPIFSKEKRNIKDNIIQLKSTLLNFDKNIEKSRIKKEYLDKYASVYGDLKGLSYMFDTFSLGELIHIFNSIYESKVNIYNEELEKIKVLKKEIKKYREIDFEDLYERLEGLDGNNKKHN